MEHFDTIYDSPCQIYHSALPFCPSSSWLCKCYSAELLNEVKVARGLSTDWGTCVRIVTLDHQPQTMSYWNNTVAVGLRRGDIIILNAITGSQTGVLSGHSNFVRSVTFSSNGTLLVSGSEDQTIKLWDMQTGGVVKTFSGHDRWVLSVCISADSTVIASGSADKTIRLWNIQTGECYCVVRQKDWVDYISFLPASSQYHMSRVSNTIQQWDINGHQVGPEYTGSQIALSLDGSQFFLCNGSVITVHNAESKAIITKLQVEIGNVKCCCFSPDGRLIAANSYSTAYVWNISSSDPHPVETFVGHCDNIQALAFSSPSSLISVSLDKSVRFWQIGTSLVDPVEADSESIAYHVVNAKSITLQGMEGIIVTSDSDGLVRIWDILTNSCNRSCQIPFEGCEERDVCLVDGRLTAVWGKGDNIHIWDAEKQELLKAVGHVPHFYIDDIKISTDGSKVFCLYRSTIEAWSVRTGQHIGSVDFNLRGPLTLIVDGSRVWDYYSPTKWEGWDFDPHLPIDLSRTPPSKLHSNGIILWDIGLLRVQDIVSGKILFQLSAGLGMPADVGWNDQYLFAYFGSGKVLVLDFSHILLQ